MFEECLRYGTPIPPLGTPLDKVPLCVSQSHLYFWNVGTPEQRRIRDAMKVFEQNTCLSFKQHTNEKHWINFRRLDG